MNDKYYNLDSIGDENEKIWQMVELLEDSSLLTFFTQAACFLAYNFGIITITSDTFYDLITGIFAIISIVVVEAFYII